MSKHKSKSPEQALKIVELLAQTGRSGEAHAAARKYGVLEESHELLLANCPKSKHTAKHGARNLSATAEEMEA